jgi:hypothetical protein
MSFSYKFLSTPESATARMGVVLDNITTEDIIKELHLDTFEVQKEPNHDNSGAVIKDSHFLKRVVLPKYVGTEFDVENGYIYKPYVRDKYQVLQYVDGVPWVNYFIMEGLLTITSVFYVHPGNKLAILCDINVQAEIVKGDIVRRYLLVVFSHDGSPRFIGYTDICPICTNTLASATAEAMGKAGKSFNLDVEGTKSTMDSALKAAHKLIDLTRNNFRDVSLLQYQAYEQLVLEPGQVDYIKRTVLNAPLAKEPEAFSENVYLQWLRLNEVIESSPGQDLRTKGNAFHLLSGISNFTQGFGEGAGDKYNNNMFGRGPTMRRQAGQLLDALLPKSYIPVKETKSTKLLTLSA